MIAQPPPIPPAPFKDRKTGLVVFGILTALIGAVCALFVALIFLAQAVAARTTVAGPPGANILPGIIFFGFMAVILVWLGIGSIKARRWARALLLVFAWSWLLMGTFSLTLLLIMLPRMIANIRAASPAGRTEMPPGAKIIVIVVAAVMVFTMYIVLPGVWALFYGRKDVKRTCELRDPKPRWTDRCPLPVLGVSLWLLLGALMMLAMPFAFHGIFPLFGTFLFGWPGIIVYMVLTVLWMYTAWALYRLDRRGWWVLFVVMTTLSVSAFITYSRHDLIEIYRIAGYSEAQLTQLQRVNVLNGAYISWISLICTVPFLLYLLYIRKFFRRDRALPRGNAA
jgi:hypothetical protein